MHLKMTKNSLIVLFIVTLMFVGIIYLKVETKRKTEAIDIIIMRNFGQLTANLSVDTDVMDERELLQYKQSNMKYAYLMNEVYYQSSFFADKEYEDFKTVIHLLISVLLFDTSELSQYEALIESMNTYLYRDNLINGQASSEIVRVLSGISSTTRG